MTEVTSTLSVQAHQESGGETVVEPVGDLDLATVDLLREELMPAVERGTTVLDLVAVGFCDSSGLRLLVEAHRRAESRGTRLLLAAPTTPVQRLLDITGADKVFALYPDVPSAREAALGDAAPAGAAFTDPTT